ncbi:MAG: hypothetical protein QW101_04060 [Ignisphaera sp.]|uniref:Uncharacterized protein n=1 Tax=Ignisphaera aggregans TaxID=334771 RepID=A0A832AAI6_9CREN
MEIDGIPSEDRSSVIEVLKKGVDIYNKYRAPEATGVIEDVNGEHVGMKFFGHFCRTCGVIDWIEDYVYIVKDLGIDIDIVDIDHEADSDYIMVKFRIRGSVKEYEK